MTRRVEQRTDDEVVFTPSVDAAAASQLAEFWRHCEAATGLRFPDYAAFDRFAVDSYRTFWKLFLEWSGLVVEGDVEPVCVGDEVETAEFLPNLRLSYVENLLREIPEAEGTPALVAHHSARSTASMTRAELRRQVLTVAGHLKERGVSPGDRVAAVSANTEQLVVVGLAVMALGATLSTTAPDLGVPATLARFVRLAPAILVYGVADAPSISAEAGRARLLELVEGLPSVRAVLVLDDLEVDESPTVPAWRYAELLQGGPGLSAGWPRFPFSQPLWVLFSSGTTGPPKCLVHTAGGALLEHLKEHVLHGDLRADDVLFFQTSPAWMMWNWLISALATGATIVLNDGAVSEPGALWRVVEDSKATVFGTGPAYLQFCASSDYRPADEHDLSALRSLMSTGSVLYDHQFDWVREHVGDVAVQSISGGTDIVGCFLLGNPLLPVRRGELQCRSLGLDVRVSGADELTGVGELTCHNPFPSRPSGLLGDDSGSAFHAAYFADNPGVWTHGDLVEIGEHGSARIHGRSDGVMNINGVRIAPAEIYTLLADTPGLQTCMALEQRTPEGREQSRLVLLVVMEEGHELDDALETSIRRLLGSGASPVHVPGVIAQVPDLPRTHSGKDSERAAREALEGVTIANQAALRNPEILRVVREAVEAADRERDRRHSRDLRMAQGDHQPTLVGDLATIFSLVLGVPVGPDDNFFELGGTSILIAPLCQAIEHHHGHVVPLSTVWGAPTPRALARSIEGNQPSPRRSIVTLKEGDPGLRPIFLLFDATGDVLYYLPLVAQLPGNRPVFGVRARGLDEGEDLDGSVEDMAESAIDCIRTVQPGGTYTLVGSSFGGLVAYETAHRLLEAGMTVDVVLLADSYLGEGALSPSERRRFVRWERPRQRLRWLLHARPTLVRGVLARIRRRLVSGRDVPDAGPHATARQQRVMASCYDALRRYQPPHIECKVVFIRAQVRFANKPDPVPLWSRLADPGLFSVIHVSGRHGQTLVPPRLDSLMPQLTSLFQ